MVLLYTPQLILQRAIPPFWHPQAVLALDFRNSKFMAAGKVFDSICDMVAAGIYTQVGQAPAFGDTINLAGIFSGGGSYALHGIAMAGATGGNRNIAYMDAGAATNMVALARQSTTVYRGIQVTASVTTAQIDVTVAATSSLPINMAISCESNNYDFGANGTTGSHDSSGGVISPTTMYIGQSRAGSNGWDGTIRLIQLLSGSLTATKLAYLTAAG